MKLKKIKPLGSAVVVTAHVYPVDYKENGIISSKAGKLMEYQEVISVGTSVINVKEGDTVKIDISRYAEWKYKKDSIKSSMEECTNQIVGYHIPTLTLNDKEALYLSLQDIIFVIEEMEEEQKTDNPEILVKQSNIILP